MRATSLVSVEPLRQSGGAAGPTLDMRRHSPFPQRGLNEALGLASLWRRGRRADLPETVFATGARLPLKHNRVHSWRAQRGWHSKPAPP